MTTASITNFSDYSASRAVGQATAPAELPPMTLAAAMALVEKQQLELDTAKRAHEETQQRLETELEDARLLHSISSMLISEKSLDALYQKIVEVATRIMRSDFGTMQRLDEERGELQLIAQQGLNDEALAFWGWVHLGRATTCGRALELNDRVITPDFETCDFIAGSEDLLEFRKANVRAAQSTPLLTREGKLVGMLTTHWTGCHTPGERELRLLDIVARQAADVIERAAGVQALRDRADQMAEADRHKNEFLATLAHELRNPLAPIRSGLTVLKMGKLEQSPRILDVMERQLGHMVRLIDDLLDVSRVSSGKIILKPVRVELSNVIESAVEASRPLINTSGHRLTVTMPDAPIWLDADPTRIAQIIGNLLNNAAKYTPRGGLIDLVIDTLDGAARIRVSDNGIGITEAMLPKIFDLFTQVDDTIDRSQGGLGVGLALARSLARMHDGTVQADSAGRDRGSVFTLTLPCAAATVGNAGINDPFAPGENSRRILVVDDNSDAAETLALVLEGLGHTAQVVFDSRVAVAVALKFQPEVIFLDLGMPTLNGYDLARLLRAEPKLERVCLVALSGWGTDEDRARSRLAGIDHHLTKPVPLTEVINLLG